MWPKNLSAICLPWLPKHSIIFRRFGPLLTRRAAFIHTCGWFERHQVNYWHWHAWQLCCFSTSWRICCVHAPTGRPWGAHSEKDFETQHRFYESHYACDITLLICNAYILNNLFTTYTNYVCATFLPHVQEYRECDIRRLRNNGVLVYFWKPMSLGRWHTVKTCEGLR